MGGPWAPYEQVLTVGRFLFMVRATAVKRPLWAKNARQRPDFELLPGTLGWPPTTNWASKRPHWVTNQVPYVWHACHRVGYVVESRVIVEAFLADFGS